MISAHARADVVGPHSTVTIRGVSSSWALENPGANGCSVISCQPPPGPSMRSDIASLAPSGAQRVEQPPCKISGRCVCGGNLSSSLALDIVAANSLDEKPGQFHGALWVGQPPYTVSGGCVCGGNFSPLPVTNALTKQPYSPLSHLGLSFNRSVIFDLASTLAEPLRIKGGGCCGGGGGDVRVGANTDKNDDQLEKGQQALREEAAARSRSPGGSQPVPVLVPPPQAAIREHKPSQASRRTTSQPTVPPQASQSEPGRRMPVKTLPPHLVAPHAAQPLRHGGGRAQSMGGKPTRPNLPP